MCFLTLVFQTDSDVILLIMLGLGQVYYRLVCMLGASEDELEARRRIRWLFSAVFIIVFISNY